MTEGDDESADAQGVRVGQGGGVTSTRYVEEREVCTTVSGDQAGFDRSTIGETDATRKLRATCAFVTMRVGRPQDPPAPPPGRRFRP